LMRFVEAAWPEARRQRIDREFLVADTYPTRGMFQGMSDAFVGGRPEPEAIGGRAGWWGLDSSNPIVAGTYEAARWAADVALTTVDLVLGGETAAYGLCRPPGHHAAAAMAGGYCFFNNAAIAAQSIAASTGERVAILDVDVHHGNGTQQIFWRREDVLYVSLHADPKRLYPFFLGHSDEVGEGPGRGANLNLPQPLRADDASYLADLDRALERIASEPGSVLVVSLGFDTFHLDPIGDLALTTVGYYEMGRRVAALGRRLVILQEGGYHIPALGENARAWLRGAGGRPASGGTISGP
ncbi:MAG: histone deacetylase family protein, partial [Chloroflexi bacterium]|nr:histone deacetylase family protein [Chloroflexota bacterium]